MPILATSPGYVPNAPIREAFERSGLTCYEVARRLELYRVRRGKREPDDNRVRERLGLKTYRAGRETRKRRVAVSIGVAWDLCCAIGVDPDEIGLEL